MTGKSKILKEELEANDASLMINEGTVDLRQCRFSVLKELLDLEHISRVE